MRLRDPPPPRKGLITRAGLGWRLPSAPRRHPAPECRRRAWGLAAGACADWPVPRGPQRSWSPRPRPGAPTAAPLAWLPVSAQILSRFMQPRAACHGPSKRAFPKRVLSSLPSPRSGLWLCLPYVAFMSTTKNIGDKFKRKIPLANERDFL